MSSAAAIQLPRSKSADLVGDEVVRIGILADIQYANIENFVSTDTKKLRRYDNCVEQARSAASAFQERGCVAAFMLGDTVDQRGADAREAFDAIRSAMTVEFDGPMFHLVGNHEVTAFGPELPSYMTRHFNMHSDRCPQPYEVDARYMAYDVPGTGYTILVVDTYDLAVNLYPEGHPKYNATMTMLNNGLKDGKDRFEDPEANGGVGEEQLKWLKRALAHHADTGRQVLIFTHAPLLPVSNATPDVCWNGEEVMALVWEYADVVRCVLSGHHHSGARFTDHHGLEHIVIESTLESHDHHTTYAILELDPLELNTPLEMIGSGEVSSHSLLSPILRGKQQPLQGEVAEKSPPELPAAAFASIS